MATYLLHETYEYEVEADSLEQAIELHKSYVAYGENEDLVMFTQNYTNVYDSEGREA